MFQWHFDPSREKHFCVDQAASCYIYEDGTRIPIREQVEGNQTVEAQQQSTSSTPFAPSYLYTTRGEQRSATPSSKVPPQKAARFPEDTITRRPYVTASTNSTPTNNAADRGIWNSGSETQPVSAGFPQEYQTQQPRYMGTEEDVVSAPVYLHPDPFSIAQSWYPTAGAKAPVVPSDAERLQDVGRNIGAGPESIPDSLRGLQYNEENRSRLEGHKRLRETPGFKEKLDSNFRVHYPGHAYFKVGVVFRVLWPELSGDRNENRTIATHPRFPTEKIFVKVRWFVVAREGNDCCTCLSIQTYRGRGVPANKVKSHHAIMYTGDHPPPPLAPEYPRGPYELGMGDPIRVIPYKPWERMNPVSRVNFTKLYTVEHNVKVHMFGYVDKDQRQNLIQQFNSAWRIPDSDGPLQRPLQHGTDSYPPPPAKFIPWHPSQGSELPPQMSFSPQMPPRLEPKLDVDDKTEADMAVDRTSATKEKHFEESLCVPSELPPYSHLDRKEQTKFWEPDQLDNHIISMHQTSSEGTVDPEEELLDDMRAMLNAKARNGDNAFSETQLKDSQDVHEGSSRIKTLQQDHEDDDSSVISSYAASVFSIRSLASSATDLAKASGYSVDDIATATEELLAIFHKDSDLAPLYLSAIEDSSIGPQRLQRNLRRIFKQYAEHLKSEANDQLEFLASRLVSSKAGFLAQSIVERCSEITVTMKHETLHNTGGEEKSDLGQKGKEEDDDHEDEEEEEEEASFVYNADFGDVVAFRKFLRNSDAFQSLRTQIQNFVLPKPSRITRPEVAIEGDDTGAHSEAKDQEQRGVKPTQILRRIMWTFDTFLVATGYLEPPLEPARVRLRWKCRCGESFTSDVRMYETDGVSELKAHVERVTGSEVTLTPYSRNSTNQRYVYQRPGLWLQKALTRLATTFKRTSKQCMLPQHNPNSNTTHSTQGTNSHHQNTNYLLACMHSGQYGKMLHQDCIDTIDTDRKLFCFLRQQFTHCRGRFRTILSLKKVKGIYFVRFNLFMSGSVEVRYHHQCCENTCECIPPKSLVEPSPQAEYRCKPAGPLKSGPPVLPDLLSHYFAKPSCIIDKDNSILSRLPKRISSELQGKLGEPVEGWGIYYQEGWDGDIITLVVVVMFLMGSLLFGILWSRLKMDVQGAFGVSAWIITAGALFIQLIVMRMGKV